MPDWVTNSASLPETEGLPGCLAFSAKTRRVSGKPGWLVILVPGAMLNIFKDYFFNPLNNFMQ